MKLKIVTGEYLDANIYILSENGKAIIIDSGAKLNDIKNAVGKNKVLGVLLTHGHYDHALYALDYSKEFDCPIFIHKSGKEVLLDPKKNYGETFYIDNFTNFKFLEGDGILILDEIKIEYFSTAGHSPCGMCYLINGDLFAGDTLFDNGIGRTDLNGSDKEQMLLSLEKLSALNFNNVYSGHGASSDATRQKRNIQVHIRFLKRAL